LFFSGRKTAIIRLSSNASPATRYLQCAGIATRVGARRFHSFHPAPMHTLLSESRRPLLRKWVSVAVISAIVFVAACSSDIGAAKLKSIPKGAKRDVVLAAMGTGPLAAATPVDAPRIVDGFRRQKYLTGGQTYEVLWYREEPGSLADPITKERETPIVIQGDTLLLWGWSKYTPFAAKLNLPDPTHDKARADSIQRLQNPGTPKP
jgi:hypothetical protein